MLQGHGKTFGFTFIFWEKESVRRIGLEGMVDRLCGEKSIPISSHPLLPLVKYEEIYLLGFFTKEKTTHDQNYRYLPYQKRTALLIKQDVWNSALQTLIYYKYSPVLLLTVINKHLAVPELGSCLVERQRSLAEGVWTLDKTQDSSVLPFIVFCVDKCINMVKCSCPNCKIEIIAPIYEFSCYNNMNC